MCGGGNDALPHAQTSVVRPGAEDVAWRICQGPHGLGVSGLAGRRVAQIGDGRKLCVDVADCDGSASVARNDKGRARKRVELKTRHAADGTLREMVPVRDE